MSETQNRRVEKLLAIPFMISAYLLIIFVLAMPLHHIFYPNSTQFFPYYLSPDGWQSLTSHILLTLLLSCFAVPYLVNEGTKFNNPNTK